MPTGKGGNLTQPLKKVLINQPNPDNLGAYIDAQIGSRVLQFKQHGYSLIANGQQTVAVQQPQAHLHKTAIFQFSNLAPVNPLNHEYGFKVLQRVRTPGVQNSKFFGHMKYYGGTSRVTAGGITDAELTAMTNDVISQINGDIGITRRFDYQMPGAAVVARRITDARITLIDYIAAAAGSFQINDDTPIAVGAEANIGAYVDAINAAVGLDGRILATLNPAALTTSIIIDVLDPTIETLRWIPTAAISAEMKDNTAVVRVFDTYDADSAGVFTFASPNGNTTVTVGAVANRNAFVVAANAAVAAAPAVAGRVRFTYAVDAAEVVVHAIDKSITDITFVHSGAGTLALDAASNAAYDLVYDAAISAQAGQILLVNRWVDATFEVQFEAAIGNVTVVRQGRFALLSNEDVQRVFSHIPNDGFLGQERRHPNLVLPGVDYVRITITVPQIHYDLGGASHQNMFLTAIEVYMPAAEWNVIAGAAVNERWAAAAGAPLRMMDAGATDNIADLMAWWQA